MAKNTLKSMNNIAAALSNQGKYTEAEPILKKALEADPTYGPAHNDLGLIYYRLDRPYDAASQARQG